MVRFYFTLLFTSFLFYNTHHTFKRKHSNFFKNIMNSGVSIGLELFIRLHSQSWMYVHNESVKERRGRSTSLYLLGCPVALMVTSLQITWLCNSYFFYLRKLLLVINTPNRFGFSSTPFSPIPEGPMHAIHFRDGQISDTSLPWTSNRSKTQSFLFSQRHIPSHQTLTRRLFPIDTHYQFHLPNSSSYIFQKKSCTFDYPLQSHWGHPPWLKCCFTRKCSS